MKPPLSFCYPASYPCLSFVKFEVPTAVKINTILFWGWGPWNFIDRYQHFGETFCLPRQSRRWISRFFHKRFYQIRMPDIAYHISLYIPERTVPTLQVLSIYSSQWQAAIVSWSKDRFTTPRPFPPATNKWWKWSRHEAAHSRICFCSRIKVKWETL